MNKTELLSPGNFISVQGSLLLRKIKQRCGKKNARQCSGISRVVKEAASEWRLAGGEGSYADI